MLYIAKVASLPISRGSVTGRTSLTNGGVPRSTGLAARNVAGGITGGRARIGREAALTSSARSGVGAGLAVGDRAHTIASLRVSAQGVAGLACCTISGVSTGLTISNRTQRNIASLCVGAQGVASLTGDAAVSIARLAVGS